MCGPLSVFSPRTSINSGPLYDVSDAAAQRRPPLSEDSQANYQLTNYTMTLIIVTCVTIACLPVNPATVVQCAQNGYAMFVYNAGCSVSQIHPPGDGDTPDLCPATGLEPTA